MSSEKREIKPSYIAQDADLMQLVDWRWPNADFTDLMAARHKHPIDRVLLVDELRLQNKGLKDPALVLANIEALAHANTFTVTTGHQVCLLGGPMFTLYKIATTIAMTNQLGQRYPTQRFVPVLWMATEDHDWEEVNHFYPAFGEKRTYLGQFTGPVGRHLLEQSIVDLLPANVAAYIREIYQPGRSLAEAFRLLMHHLFGQYGLVIIDPDRPALKSAFAPTMIGELNGNGVANAVRASTATLESLGFKAQIHPREINLFYIGDGKRRLIDRHEDGFKLKDGDLQWTPAAIIAALKTNPEHFSPNVSLRPLYQESILPNLAYVGGWAEVGYWLQLRDAFSVKNTFYPMVVPRLHATLFTEEESIEWTAMGMQIQDISLPIHILNDSFLDKHWDESALISSIAGLEKAFTDLSLLVEALDPTLAMGIKAEQAKTANALDAMRKKLRKSLRNRNPQPYQAIAALKNAVEPENAPQQRTLNFTAFNSIQPVNLAQLIVEHAAWDQSQTQWITLS